MDAPPPPVASSSYDGKTPLPLLSKEDGQQWMRTLRGEATSGSEGYHQRIRGLGCQPLHGNSRGWEEGGGGEGVR